MATTMALRKAMAPPVWMVLSPVLGVDLVAAFAFAFAFPSLPPVLAVLAFWASCST